MQTEKIVDGELVDEVEETSEYEAGSFEHSMQKLSGAISNASVDGFKNAETVARALTSLVEVAADTIKYVSKQETKREEIRAKRDIAIEKINKTSELIRIYLDKTFDERKDIFNKQFEVVDEALRTGNTQMLSLGLNSINQLASQSPFKNLADINQVQAALMDENTEWDI